MAKVETTERALAQLVWNTRTTTDVAVILEMAQELYGRVTWRPVGDRENNIGTIRLGSDPGLGIIERVTNGMDALLDLGHFQHVGDPPTTPREAARLWYGVPAGGVGDMTESERRLLGERLQVWLDESGVAKRPTVVIEDQGIGQSPERFPRTLLSLNDSNKVRQTWNMGTYGQGGSVTYGFSEATVITSRRHPDFRDGLDDRVGWTVVMEYETDPTLQVMPSYRYLVGPDNEVLTFPPDLVPDLLHGTRISHVEYDLQGLHGPFTTAFWQFLHNALFDPVLPFMIAGRRKKEPSYGSRIIIGNVARLSRTDKARGDIEIPHFDSVTIDLKEAFGSVTYNYWVVRRAEGSKTSDDAAASYVRPDSAVSMTLFGQRQDTESRQWINQNAMLPFLFKNMVVQVDADGLTPRAKREIFASTRERATKSDLRARIYEQLAFALRADEELKRLNHEEKERLLQRSTAASSEKVRQRLAKFIKSRLPNRTKVGKGSADAGTGGSRKRGGGGPSTPRDTSDDHLPNVPTALRFTKDVMRIDQGARAYCWVEIDAKNGYLPDYDDTLSVVWEGAGPDDKVRLTMRSRLLGGKSRWVFEADGDAALGDYALRASLLTSNGVLGDTITVTVAKPSTAKPKASGTEPETGPEVVWVRREAWDEHGMDARTVGRVAVDDESTIIFVNRNYHRLDAALAGRSLTAEQIETRATRYQYPVACALWLQDHDLRNTDPKPDARYQKAELERLAEAVLVAIDPDVDVALEESEV